MKSKVRAKKARNRWKTLIVPCAKLAKSHFFFGNYTQIQWRTAMSPLEAFMHEFGWQLRWNFSWPPDGDLWCGANNTIFIYSYLYHLSIAFHLFHLFHFACAVRSKMFVCVIVYCFNHGISGYCYEWKFALLYPANFWNSLRSRPLNVWHFCVHSPSIVQC